ncbi:MAG: aldose 1-epimerase family protein [Victivallaceae bacterium]|nr:aldose 1-epimerase family protein [Victivallaceae bacterium]
MSLYSENDRPCLGSMRQLAAIRNLQIAEGPGRGMRLVEIDNGSGLRFSVYPDRALDIGEASFRGENFVWLPNDGASAPAFYDAQGFEWLRTWGGGMMTTCGFLNVGGPGEAGGENHGLHGRISHTPVTHLSTDARWENGRYQLTVSGEARHARVFGENLLLRRKITTFYGENTIEIENCVTNDGFRDAPYMLLMHMNFGWPLVSFGAYLEAPKHEVIPQNAVAQAGLKAWQYMEEPQKGFTEQVFYHKLPSGADGFAAIELVNHDSRRKLRVAYRTKELPYLVEWKMMGQGEYVLGLEPANCLPEGQNANAARKTLQTLAPGESATSVVRVSIEEL